MGPPAGKGEHGSGKGVLLQVRTKGRTRTVLLPPFENVPPLSLIGPVPELWPGSPGLSTHRRPSAGAISSEP